MMMDVQALLVNARVTVAAASALQRVNQAGCEASWQHGRERFARRATGSLIRKKSRAQKSPA